MGDRTVEVREKECETCKANGERPRPKHNPRTHFSCGTPRQNLIAKKLEFTGWEAIIDRPAEAQHLKVLVEVYEVLKRNSQPVDFGYFASWCRQYKYLVLWDTESQIDWGDT